MKFFFDNCVSIAMARAVGEIARSQRFEVKHLTDLFPSKTIDVEWIVALRGGGWNVVSGDTRIFRNPVECAVWKETGLAAFFLDDGPNSGPRAHVANTPTPPNCNHETIAPGGFEPPFADPKSAVLPLDEGAKSLAS